MKVSIFKSVKDPNTPFNKDVLFALERIKNGNSRDQIERLRLMSDEDYSRNKACLPGVCFSGTFKTRTASGITQHSGLITLDFDRLESIDEAEKLKSEFTKMPIVFACWISPSGKGIKVLVKIPAIIKKHKGFFVSLKEHFNHPNWDDSGKDVSRFCFESFDAGIYINYDSEVWTQITEPDISDVGIKEPLIPELSTNIIVKNLMTWWSSKYGMTKGSKNNKLYVLAKAFFDFGVSESEALSECLNFDEGGKENEITQIVKSSYKGGMPGTKFFEDVNAKEKIIKKIRSGASKKEIQTDFPSVDISRFKDEMFVDEFWYYNDKGKIFLSNHKFKFYLEQNNFFKYYPTESSAAFTFIKKHQNLLEETSDKRIKDYVLNDILSRSEVGYGPYDFVSGNTSYFKSDFLSMLSTTDIKMKKDTAESGYLYFKNCVVKVTGKKVELQDYIDIDGYVWKKQIIDRDFKKADHHQAEYRKFLWLIAGQDVNKYNTFKSVCGYLLHSYKTSSNNKAIIFNDGTISDNPNGGSGKGLFWNALKNMKKVTRIDGKSFEPTKSFPYALVSTDTQILVFDDVKRNFNFESLFSLITEGITIEYKGQDPFTVPVEDSPKLIITTNYTIGGSGGSFDRRKFEVEMSSYFNSRHSPEKEFGHMLFNDWDEAEWSRFDNFMINCFQYYLENGLVSHEFDNLDVRKYHKDTNQDFDEWTKDEDNIKFGVRMDKSVMYTSFVKEYPDHQKWLKQKKFTQWLEIFAEFHNYKIEQGRTHSMRYVEFNKDINAVTTNHDGEDSDVPF